MVGTRSNFASINADFRVLSHHRGDLFDIFSKDIPQAWYFTCSRDVNLNLKHKYRTQYVDQQVVRDPMGKYEKGKYIT